jgi:hypothetical protein
MDNGENMENARYAMHEDIAGFINQMKNRNIIVLFLTDYLSLYLNHGDLKNMLQKVISKLLL